jgi:hypothetical protein
MSNKELSLAEQIDTQIDAQAREAVEIIKSEQRLADAFVRAGFSASEGKVLASAMAKTIAERFLRNTTIASGLDVLAEKVAREGANGEMTFAFRKMIDDVRGGQPVDLTERSGRGALTSEAQRL